MKQIILDSNVIVRLLRADHPEHFQDAKELFLSAESGKFQLLLFDAVLAEVVYVLSSVYKIDRKVISNLLLTILFNAGINCPSAVIIADALDRYCSKNVDFIDAYIAAQASASNLSIVSFDNDLRKFKDITTHKPSSC